MADFYSADAPKTLRKLRQLKPDMFKSFIDFDQAVFKDGAISRCECALVGCVHDGLQMAGDYEGGGIFLSQEQRSALPRSQRGAVAIQVL